MLTAPDRLEHIDWLRERSEGTRGPAGNMRSATATAPTQKRTAELRTDLIMAEIDLAKDAKAFVAD